MKKVTILLLSIFSVLAVLSGCSSISEDNCYSSVLIEDNSIINISNEDITSSVSVKDNKPDDEIGAGNNSGTIVSTPNIKPEEIELDKKARLWDEIFTVKINNIDVLIPLTTQKLSEKTFENIDNDKFDVQDDYVIGIHSRSADDNITFIHGLKIGNVVTEDKLIGWFGNSSESLRDGNYLCYEWTDTSASDKNRTLKIIFKEDTDIITEISIYVKGE